MNKIFICILLFFSTISVAEDRHSKIFLELDDSKCRGASRGGYLDVPPSGSMYFSLKPFNDVVDREFGRDCMFRNIKLEGGIDEFTFEQFKFAIEVFSQRGIKNPKTGAGKLILNSPGGLILVAMKIGDLVAENEMEVGGLIFANNSQCSSACIFIYAAGIFRDSGTKLGIHRPFSQEISINNLSYKDYLKEYDALTPVMKSYLKKYGVSSSIVDAMNVIPSNEVRFLTFEEKENYGIGLVNIAYAEYQKAKTIQLCGKKYHDDYVGFLNIIDQCKEQNNDSIPWESTNENIVIRSTEINELCWNTAEKKFPNLKKMAKECDQKIASQANR